MKDPKVVDLVKQFEKDVKALNTTWSKLQTSDVYIKLDIKGQSTYIEPKYLLINEITQHVKYTKEKE
jgi:hypothetical protein